MRRFYHGTDSINMQEIRRHGGLCVPRVIGKMCDRNDPACDSDAIYVTTDFREAASFARMATRDENSPSVVFEILESDLPEGTMIVPDDYIGGPEKNAYRIKGASCVLPSRFTIIREESRAELKEHRWEWFVPVRESARPSRLHRHVQRKPVRVHGHRRRAQ